MTTDQRVTQTESVLAIFAISVCKIPIRKDNSHRDRKEHKERMTTDQRVPKPNPSSRSLRSLCVKIRSEKTIHAEIAKNTKERMTTDVRVRVTRTESVYPS
jgi:hypothetical protein